jgi:hypothetical protein
VSTGVLRCALLGAGPALLAAVLPGAVGAAPTANTAELDPGTCGQILQVGSDPTASSSPTPSFLLRGDGGLSSYVVSIDGVEIGRFDSTNGAIVCIPTTTPLVDGPHMLTGVEIRPHPGDPVTPLHFSVDTVPPAPPSQPVISDYTDSGVQGDGITSYARVNFTGTARPGEPVHVYRNGITVLGGAITEADGRWSATSVPLADGTWSISAVTLDSAGNRSSFSGATMLTVDRTPPVAPDAPVLDEAAGGPSAVKGVAAPDVARILVFGDGTQLGSATPDQGRAWRFALESLAPGSHEIAVAAADAADNVTPLSSTLTVIVEPPAPPPQPVQGPPPDPGPAPPPEPAPPPPEPAPPPPPDPDPTPPAPELPPPSAPFEIEPRSAPPDFAPPAGPRAPPPRRSP